MRELLPGVPFAALVPPVRDSATAEWVYQQQEAAQGSAAAGSAASGSRPPLKKKAKKNPKDVV
jgi:hypothetical protein